MIALAVNDVLLSDVMCSKISVITETFPSSLLPNKTKCNLLHTPFSSTMMRENNEFYTQCHGKGSLFLVYFY